MNEQAVTTTLPTSPTVLTTQKKKKQWKEKKPRSTGWAVMILMELGCAGLCRGGVTHGSPYARLIL